MCEVLNTDTLTTPKIHACRGCGFKKPRLFYLAGKGYVVKCDCGLNTGHHKALVNSLRVWNDGQG